MNPEYIVTLSTAYSGSTLLDLLMGSAMRGVRSVGESHWILDDAGNMPWVKRCARCKSLDDLANCPIERVVQEVRSEGLDDHDLYPALWRAMREYDGSTILHTSDKWAALQRRFLPSEDFRSIVLWKRPNRAWGSARKHRTHGRGGLAQFANDWATNYTAAIQLGSPKIVVSYERLVTDPEAELQRIARLLDLEYDPTWRERWYLLDDLHRVAGNERPFRIIRTMGPWIGLDQSYKDLLTERDLEYVKAAWAKHQSVIHTLEDLSI